MLTASRASPSEPVLRTASRPLATRRLATQGRSQSCSSQARACSLHQKRVGSRKGQLIIEFLIASVLFFIILLTILMSVNSQAGRFSVAAADTELQAAAFRVADQLVRSPGMWNFSAPSASALGLAKSPGILDQRKLDTFQGICTTDYPTLLSLLDLGERPFASARLRVLVTNSTRTIIDCGPAVSAEKPAFVERIALQESGAAARLLVWIW